MVWKLTTSVNVDIWAFLLNIELSLNSNNILYQKRIKLKKNLVMKHVFEESILSIVNTEVIFAGSTLYIFHDNFCLS